MRMRMLMRAFLIIGFMLLLFACAQNEAMRNVEQSAAPVSALAKHVEVDFSQSCYDCHLIEHALRVARHTAQTILEITVAARASSSD